MPTHSETTEIARPPQEVWRLLAEPERWLAGYRETRSRSPEYPGPHTHNDYVFHTRMNEEVKARVSRSEAPALLEEDQEAKTFARHLRYRLEPTDGGTRLTVADEITFKGLARLAAPLASRDARRRWAGSLERIRSVAEAAR